MTRVLLTATTLGSLAGLLLTYQWGAVGLAVCAGGVVAWYLVRAVRDTPRRNRGRTLIYPRWDITGPGSFLLPEDDL